MSTTYGKSLARYHRIKVRLLRRGLTFADIARRTGVSRSMVSYTAAGRKVSRRVRMAVAKAAGVTYRNLWGAQS